MRETEIVKKTITRMNMEKYLKVAKFLDRLNGMTTKNRIPMVIDLHFQAIGLLSSIFPVASSMRGRLTILKTLSK